MAAKDRPYNPHSKSGLRFKDGPYLTPKVERIMLLIAHGKSVKWIAGLYDVREPFIYYVARKTGFPSTVFNAEKRKAASEELEPAW